MTYLDLHRTVVWLYQGDLDFLSQPAKEEIKTRTCWFHRQWCWSLNTSPNGQLKARAAKVMATLAKDIGLALCQLVQSVVEQALGEK